MTPAARGILLTAALTHVLHDGFSDALYVLLPLWATEFRLTLTQVGVLKAVYTGGMALSQVPAGFLAERWGERRLLGAGTAIAVKTMRPEVRVIGVQAAACAPFLGSPPADGAVVTLADGIGVKHPGAITRPLVETWVDEVVAVDEDTIAEAMVLLMERAKLYVEGAGAVGVAALLSGVASPSVWGTTCVVLSGGNVDLGVVPGLIRRHETQAGRRLTVFVRIDDRPGGLARLLAIFAEVGANLIEVQHVREGVALHVRETGVRATFEVRGRERPSWRSTRRSRRATTSATKRDRGRDYLLVGRRGRVAG